MTDTDLDFIKLNKLVNIAGKLIRDRTQPDVDYALECERNGVYTKENLRGAYNISDRNRVGEAVNFIIDCLKNIRIYEAYANILRDDWNAYDIIVEKDNRKVLNALENLKHILPYGETQEIPDSLDSLTYHKTNAIESIIFDLYGVFLRLLDSCIYSGDGFASDFDPFNWQGFDN